MEQCSTSRGRTPRERSDPLPRVFGPKGQKPVTNLNLHQVLVGVCAAGFCLLSGFLFASVCSFLFATLGFGFGFGGVQGLTLGGWRLFKLTPKMHCRPGFSKENPPKNKKSRKNAEKSRKAEKARKAEKQTEAKKSKQKQTIP